MDLCLEQATEPQALAFLYNDVYYFESTRLSMRGAGRLPADLESLTHSNFSLQLSR